MTRKRHALCLSFLPRTDDVPSSEVEASVRAVGWEERALAWRDCRVADVDGIGCGFHSGDAYAEYSQSERFAVTPWMPVGCEPIGPAEGQPEVLNAGGS